MNEAERRFALLVSGAHGVDHFLKRVFPPLVPVWAVVFELSLWKLGMLLGALSLGSAVGQAPMGHLSDRYDRRVILPGGIAVMGASSVLVALVPAMGLSGVSLVVGGTAFGAQFLGMVVVMFFIGLGSSVLHPTGFPLISRNVRDDNSGTVIGMWGSAKSFGDGFAPAVVGVALLVVGWQSIVGGFGVAGLLFAGYLFVRLKSYETRPVTTDSDGRDSEETAVGFGNRRRFVYPLLAIFATSVLLSVATFGATVFFPEFITSEYGYSLTVAGFRVTPTSTASFYYSALLVTAGVTQLGTGRLVDRYDHRKVLIGYCLVGGTLMFALGTMELTPLALLGVLLLLGTTLWGLNPARDAIISDIAPVGGEGRTFGYLWAGILLVSSVSPVFIGYVGDVAGLREAFVWITVFVFLSVVPVALLLSNRVYVGAPEPATRG